MGLYSDRISHSRAGRCVYRLVRRNAPLTLLVDGEPAAWSAYLQVAGEELIEKVKGFFRWE